MNYQALEISTVQQCELCFNKFEHLYNFQCIEQTLTICNYCFSEVNVKRRNNFYMEIYQSLYYKLKLLMCSICEQSKICSKICEKEHFCCLDCTKQYCEEHLQDWFIECPILKCTKEVDQYIIALFIHQEKFKEWQKLEKLLICQNKRCENEVKFQPHHCAVSKVIHNCGQNNSTVSFNKMSKSLIIQCPKCRYYNPNEQEKMKQTQECYICTTKFCLFCNSGNQQLFFLKNKILALLCLFNKKGKQGVNQKNSIYDNFPIMDATFSSIISFGFDTLFDI